MKRFSILASALLLSFTGAAAAQVATVGEAAAYPGERAAASVRARADVRAETARPDVATPYVFLTNEGVLVDNPAYRAPTRTAGQPTLANVQGPWYLN